MDQREFDVILWGATGFTGRLVASHLLEAHGDTLRWALGGRSLDKLEHVRRELGESAAEVPLVIADADDQASLDALAERTRVVCSTVGPYALHGSKLVASCVHHGTHYCDLTGEVPWMRRMIDAHHLRAEETGARIVHTCGFDSIPSDLGVLYLRREMLRRGLAAESDSVAVKMRIRETRGGVSGGTVASLLNMAEEAQRDEEIRDVLADPYGLNPAGERRGLDGPERTLPEYDQDFGGWVAPFPMSAINVKVVRRSNALMHYAYGHEFRYDEGLLMPFGPWGFALAAGVSAGTAAAGAAVSVGALRRALTPLLPRPGDGPSRTAREAGYWHAELLGRAGESTLRVSVRGAGDPGYASTSRMLGEAAVCLATDPLTSRGGVLTPASAMGEALMARLELHAGVTFEVVE